MFFIFRDARAFNQNISYNSINNTWNTSKVTTMHGMFIGATAFNNGLESGASGTLNWITDSLTSVGQMFQSATSFNQQISANGLFWNMSKVTNINYVFLNATVFNNGDVSLGTSKPLNWSFNTTSLTSTDWNNGASALTATNSRCFQNGVAFVPIP
jgi:hypothetical protein